jgi:predicted transcriptional regulator
MVEFINSGLDLNGFSAADKIVGKALAMLFALCKVKEVYAVVMSQGAIKIFEKYKIKYSYKTLVEAIINREGTGPCPMEAAVKDIDDLSEALYAIKNKLEFLRSKSQGNA